MDELLIKMLRTFGPRDKQQPSQGSTTPSLANYTSTVVVDKTSLSFSIELSVDDRSGMEYISSTPESPYKRIDL